MRPLPPLLLPPDADDVASGDKATTAARASGPRLLGALAVPPPDLRAPATSQPEALRIVLHDLAKSRARRVRELRHRQAR